MSHRHRTSDKPSCPHCGGVMMRVPRDQQERERASLQRYRRFRCCDAACDWQGMLPVKRPTPYTRVPDALTQPAAGQAMASHAPVRTSTSYAADAPAIQIQVQLSASAKHALKRWAPAGAMLVLGAVLASSALLADRASGPGRMQMVNGRVVPLGESDYGVPLPAKHPLLQQAAFKPDAPADGSAAPDEPPLDLRQSCAWGRPGGNPYKGTVEQALNTARLPPEVVKAIAAKVKAGEVTDELVISNDGIKGQRLGREFSPRGFAMTYGRSICLSTSVHFSPGHVERAALYEVNDDQGRLHSVMVPEVCGNVSVLSERGRRLPVSLLAAGDNGEVLASELAGDGGVRNVAEEGSLNVPEPGTLPVVALGLGALLWVMRRRR